MSLRFAALGLLAQQPGSGYDLLKRFEGSMANVWPATQSQLYGELNKLADAGLIEVSAIGPRGRKEYRATDAGRSELMRWMSSSEGDPPFRSAPLLRVFLLDQLTGERARAFLESVRDFADREHARYRRIRDSRDWSGSDEEFFARAALENGLRGAQMESEWAAWVLERLDQRAATSGVNTVAGQT